MEETTDVLSAGKTRGMSGDTMSEDGLDAVELLDVVSAVKGGVEEGVVEGVVGELVEMEMSGHLHDVPRARLRSQRSSSRTLHTHKCTYCRKIREKQQNSAQHKCTYRIKIRLIESYAK